MNQLKSVRILVNFSLVLFLLGLLATPFFFAKNFTKIAGVKSTSPFLLVSQIDKFPNLKFAQAQDRYLLSFEKLGDSQAFLGVLILNNPTDTTQTYILEVLAGQATLFFGEDLENQLPTITLPRSTSVSVSLFSPRGDILAEKQLIEFRIRVN